MDDLTRLANQIEQAAREAMSDALQVTLIEAKRLSSGFETRKDHRRNDHPYARRHGRVKPPNDPFLINAQSGRFLQSWERREPQDAGGKLVGVVTNSDPKGELLGRGTRLMLARPLPVVVAPLGEQALADALVRRLDRLF
jgi:hypothetical protein